jgi:PAS domain S-box-containing protein
VETPLADQNIQAARTWLSLIFQPAALFSPAGRILDFNHAFAETVFDLFQTVPRPGLSWLALVTDTATSKILSEFLRTPEGFESEIPIASRRGEVRRFHMKRRALCSENGRRVAIALSASEATGELTVEWDSATGIGILSAPLLLLLDGPDSPKASADWETRIHTEEKKEALKALRLPTLPSWTYRLKTKTGGWRWFDARSLVSEWTVQGVPAKIRILHEDVTRAKRLEQTANEAEARWESVVNGAPVGIALISKAGKILFTNGRIDSFLPSDSVGYFAKETLGADLWDRFDRALQNCFSTGQSVVLSSSLNHMTKGFMSLEHLLGPLKGSSGVESVVLFSFDTTERSRWELHNSREALVQEFVLELHRQDGDGTNDLLHKTLQAALELTSSRFGFVAVEDMSGNLEVVTMIPPFAGGNLSDLRLDRGPWTRALEQDQPLLDNGILDFPFNEGPFGRTIHRSLGIPVLRDGRSVGFVVVGQRDDPFREDDVIELRSLVDGAWQVTERRGMEQYNRLLLQALEFIPASVVITDPRGIIEYVNKYFRTLMGFEVAEAVGSHISIVDSGLDPSVSSKDLLSSIREGRSWQGELINKKKDGQLVWESVSVSPVLDLTGKIIHFVSVHEDITEKRRSQEALLQARKMESVGQLAAGVAHDFNNLLTSLLAMNDMLLLKLPQGDPLRAFPEKIAKAGSRAADLVSSLLAFGRRQRLRQKVVDLRELLREEAGLMESMLRGDVALRTSLDGPPLMVDIDAGQISQVVMNLVSNARDAMESGGTVTIGTGSCVLPTVPERGDWAFFSIKDDGPGIAEEVRERIFEPFFTTKEIGKGTGLGLSVVSGIVEQHHGKIVLESTPGQGALFTVYLPLAVSAPPVLEPTE